MEKKQIAIWKQAKELFFDYKSISFAEFDCSEHPDYCSNFVGEKLPNYVFMSDNLLSACCQRPKDFKELRAFGMELLGHNFQKKHNFFMYDAECDTIYPTLLGDKINAATFNSSISCGHHFVL